MNVRPFADTALIYRRSGWVGTLPLPPRAKSSPPDGWTGGYDRDPDDATVVEWAGNGHGPGNIALRMPADIIGIDVDAYDTWRPAIDPATGQQGWRLVRKRGAATLAELESALGPLPVTWISSARAAPSGIRLFRVPPGHTITESALPGDIEIIRRGHRYLVAPPSVNPETGTEYGWWLGSSSTPWQRQGRPPAVWELPWLPAAYAVRLSSRPASGGAPVDSFFATAKTTDTAARQWQRLADRFVGFVRRCEMFGWGGDAHGQLLELTREAAQLAPAHAHRAVGEWFAAGGAGFVDDRVWAMLDSALGKYPADKIVAPDRGKSGTVTSPYPGTASGATNTGSLGYSVAVAEMPGVTVRGGGGPTPVVSGLSSGVQRVPDRPADGNGNTSAQGPGPRRLPMIPDAVWEAYGWTRSIRARARTADVCPDAVLGACLATYAARIPPGVRIVTGTKMPLGTNLVVSLVGPSGSDKSTAFTLAQTMMPGSACPVVNNPNSGEAFAASFVHPDPDGEGSVAKRAKVLKPDPRALFYVSEGGMLGSVAGRLGSTWLPHLRALAVDEALSTTNATAEINRQVPAQAYSAGVVVGFQLTTATHVLTDTATGTAQRFLWFTSLSTEDLHAGQLAEVATIEHVAMAVPVLTRLGAGIDEENRPIHYLVVTQAITDRIRAEQRHSRLTRDITTTDDHDAHRHTLVAKLAALAALADGRVMVDDGDWGWAEALYAASGAVRDVLLELAEERDRAERATTGQRQAESDRARRGHDGDEARVARVILNRLAQVGPQGRRQLRDAVAGRDRRLFSGALEQLESGNWVTRDGSGKFHLVSQVTDQ